ncbi:MAG: hypothetical protein JXA91_06360 [Candidatus Thermoplasmatota archaeon]|nr:hypothetical protein [Candidatus Thermoplasmatota archaeon]
MSEGIKKEEIKYFLGKYCKVVKTDNFASFGILKKINDNSLFLDKKSNHEVIALSRIISVCESVPKQR